MALVWGGDKLFVWLWKGRKEARKEQKCGALNSGWDFFINVGVRRFAFFYPRVCNIHVLYVTYVAEKHSGKLIYFHFMNPGASLVPGCKCARVSTGRIYVREKEEEKEKENQHPSFFSYLLTTFFLSFFLLFISSPFLTTIYRYRPPL